MSVHPAAVPLPQGKENSNRARVCDDVTSTGERSGTAASPDIETNHYELQHSAPGQQPLSGSAGLL